MIAALYRKLAGLGLISMLIAVGWVLWVRRGGEIAAAKARQAEAVQALATAQVSLQADQQTVASLQAQQAVNNTALAQVGAASATTASTAATINAQITTSQDGPVAPVLAQTLAALAKAQGESP